MQGGSKSEEFSFHVEESAQLSGETILTEDRKGGQRNLLLFFVRSMLL
jgi:hypothetical protein